MKRWTLILVLALVCPVAGADDGRTADLRATNPVVLAEFVEVGHPNASVDGPSLEQPAPPTATHMCKDYGPTVERGEPAPSYISYVTPAHTPALAFLEGRDEVGCAEARFVIQFLEWPGTVQPATKFKLNFAAARSVERAYGNVGVYAEQGVRFYLADEPSNIGDPLLEPFDCFGAQPTFEPTLATVSPAQPQELAFDLALCPEGIGDKTLILAFYFRDADPVQNARSIPPPSGQQFKAHVADVSVTFEGAKLPLDMTLRSGSDPQQSVVGFLEASLTVPGPVGTEAMEVSFEVGNEWGIHGLYKRSDGDLEAVGAEAISAQETQGTLIFTFSDELLRAAGPGEYVVVFTGPATGQVEAYRLPLAALILVVPLFAGLLAQRNINHLYRSSRGRLRLLRAILQGLLVAAWSTYVAVAVTLVVRSTGLGMAAWPLPRANLFAYILLLSTIVVMGAIGFVARRKGTALVLEDFSDLERIQAELERSNRELEQFAYVASHDLKEPLRMVAGYTQLLEMRYGKKLDKQGKEYLLFAAEGSRRLQHMVDDLLAYSRVRSDQATYRDVDMDHVMKIVEGHLRGLLTERRVRLVYDDLPVLHGDQGQMVQLLLNLVQNAVKFSPQDEPLVEVGATHEGDRFVIAVRDEGIGINAAQQDRIFQIFQRLHLREEYDGNGIGLAMCKKIAEQMGGRIAVASEPGKGSTFTVTLPDLRVRPGRGGRPVEATRNRRPADSPA